MRLFFAIDIPESIRATLGSLPERHRYVGLRWTKPENLHITILFLGELPRTRLPQLIEAARGVAGRMRPFNLTLKGIVLAPPGRAPRMVWLTGSAPPSFKELAYNLGAATGVHAEYSPTLHVTLARSYGIISEDHAHIQKVLTVSSMEVKEFALVESTLLPEGPGYTPIQSFPLGSG